MYEQYEVDNHYFEAENWEEGRFDQAPRLDPTDAMFINQALTTGNTEDLNLIMEHAERVKAFWASIQARAATRIDAETGATPTHHTTTQERGTAHLIALARHESPRTAITYLRRMRNLIPDMLYLFSQLETGHLKEATVLEILAPFDDATVEQRKEFDRFYAANPQLFNGAGKKEAKDTAQKAADMIIGTDRLKDLHTTTQNRYVRLRQGKDCIFLNAKLPIATGTALKNYLDEQVATAKATADPRTAAQIRTDLLLRSATGTPLNEPLNISLHLELIMTDKNLFLQERDNATLTGYGTLPDDYAQRLLFACQEAAATGQPLTDEFQQDINQQLNALVHLRRLYLAPNGQDLVAMDSKERLFKGQLRHLIQLRDPYCRTPYCDNKPTQADHIKQHSRGGETSFSNSGMKCDGCNLAKEAKGWEEEVVVTGAPHRIIIRPTSNVEYISTPPPITGISRTFNEYFQHRDLLPPVPVKNINPTPPGTPRKPPTVYRNKKRPANWLPPKPEKLPPDQDPNSDTYEF